MNRREFLKHTAAGVASVALAPLFIRTVFATEESATMNNAPSAAALPDAAKWQNMSEAEWKDRLSPESYRVLRNHGTERAGTSPLNAEKRTGTYHCGGCDLPLFSSAHKYESGTGWPSFYDVAHPAHIGISKDYKLIWPRTEVHGARCKGHLGHVFEDGPQPTGLRYCLNGVALRFVPA